MFDAPWNLIFKGNPTKTNQEIDVASPLNPVFLSFFEIFDQEKF